MSDPPSNAPADSARLTRAELISSYAVSAARIGSWLLITGILYRTGNFSAVASVVLLRSMAQLVWYIAPAAQAAALRRFAQDTQASLATDPAAPTQSADRTLGYASAKTDPRPGLFDVQLATLAAIIVVVLIMAVVFNPNWWDLYWYGSTRGWSVASNGLIFFTAGMALRAFSDPLGALLQSRSRIAIDNSVVVLGELSWVVGVFVELHYFGRTLTVESIGTWFLTSQMVVLMGRGIAAAMLAPSPSRSVSFRGIRLAFGTIAVVYVGSLADYMYAPFNQLFLGATYGTVAVAHYAAIIQVDAALLLLVAGLASLILPKSASAFAAGDMRTVRRYYVRGSLISLGLLTGAAIIVWTLAPQLFRLWLGPLVPGDLRWMLGLVLLHTIIGGTAGIGRSVLLGMGKIQAYTISALLGGLLNIALVFLFAFWFQWHIAGLIVATILSVTIRCAIWMPWYVMRSIRTRERDLAHSIAGAR
jgi:O-antigen/teichoic acid export membrane protein